MLRERRNARNRGRGAAAMLAVALVVALVAPRAVMADQKHVVRSGQSLGGIARQYSISVTALAAANGIHRDGILREGQLLKVPGAGAVQVAAGQTLGKIARDHHVSVAALAAANGLGREASLQIGQRLVLPEGAVIAKAAQPAQAQGARAAVPAAKPAATAKAGVAKTDTAKSDATKTDAAKINTAKTGVTKTEATKTDTASKPASTTKSPWGKPKQPGVVELFRIWSKESVRVKLVDARGRPRQDARRALREFLRPRDSQRRKTPNARLLTLLARVSDHFGGRPLHIVSGYRVAKGLTRKTSRHVAGEAIDFYIPGVPLTVLRDYCQRFSDVGVGYYPTTEFVHLDVRKQPARWTDWSLPGQPPVLSKPAEYDENGNEEVISAPRPDDKAADRNSGVESRRRSDVPTG